MNTRERDIARTLIDAARRSVVAHTMAGTGRCTGCGCEYDHHTLKCGTCVDRHAARNRRAAVKAGTLTLSKHGLNGARLGCTCRVCRQANNAWFRAKRARAAKKRGPA